MSLSRRELLLTPLLFVARRGEAAQLPDFVGQLEDGQRIGLHELTAGKAVALQFVFTTCVTLCPLMGALFSAVQRGLPAETREKCLLLSVSVDPENDTPSKLRRFLEKHQAGPGWHTFLLGRGDLDRLLAQLGEDASSPTEHSPQTLIFGPDGKEKERLRELGKAPAIIEALRAASA